MTAPRISPKVSDDLFESSSMTFGEHLEQLRKALAKASAWVGIGLIFGLFLADDIVQYIQTPLKAALEEFALKSRVPFTPVDSFAASHGDAPRSSHARGVH